MENQFNHNQPQNFYKRRLAAIFVFVIFFTMLGRQLTFLPTINLSTNTKEEDLKTSTEKITKDKSGFYSVYYKNLKSGSTFGINENQIETGASVNKVPIIASLYYLDHQGKIDLDDKITIQKADVQDYGTGTIRYQTMPQTYSLRNLAKLALNKSDNTAAHVISVRIGEDVIQNFVDKWGMKQTSMVDNKTSNSDMALLFQNIYNGKVTDQAKTKELMDFMTSTDFEDRLAKDLPNTAKIYHKTGDGEGFVHDVGIIQTEKGTYYLGVMTSDVGNNEDQAKNTIAEISKKVYDALNNN